MPMPGAWTAAWLGYVNAFTRCALLIDMRLKTLFGCVECLDQRGFSRLDQLTERCTLFGRNAANQLFRRRQRALFSQMSRAQFSQCTLFSDGRIEIESRNR